MGGLLVKNHGFKAIIIVRMFQWIPSGLSMIVGIVLVKMIFYTLPETNIAPASSPSQKETNRIPTIHFQGRLLLVSGRVYSIAYHH